MALRIRLRRMGRKKAPHYRIVVAESSMPRDGRFVTSIGHYNPRTEPMTLVVNREQALSWMDQGATPTDTVRSLFRRAGVYGDPPLTEAVAETVSNVAEAAGKAASTATRAAGNVAGDATRAAAAATEQVRESTSGIGAAIASAVDAVTDAASGAAAAVAETVRDAAEAVTERIEGDDAEEAAAEPAAEEDRPAATEPS